jgi:hypothetical protein
VDGDPRPLGGYDIGADEYCLRVDLPLVMWAPTPTPALANGGFETGTFAHWQPGSSRAPSALAPRIVSGQRHSGQYAAVLGQEHAPCQHDLGGEAGLSWIAQTLTVPSGPSQLSVYYRMFTYDHHEDAEFDRFEIYIGDTRVFRYGDPRAQGCDVLKDSGWQRFTYDLSSFQGLTVELKLMNVAAPDDWYGTWTYVDDVQVYPSSSTASPHTQSMPRSLAPPHR